MNRTAKAPGAYSGLSVNITTDKGAGGFREFKTKEGVHMKVSTQLPERFRKAFTA